MFEFIAIAYPLICDLHSRSRSLKGPPRQRSEPRTADSRQGGIRVLTTGYPYRVFSGRYQFGVRMLLNI